MKRRKLTGWEWALFASPLLMVALLLALSRNNEPLSWQFSILQPRAMARSSSCQSNLKQIGLAMVMYSKDYDGKFPPAKIGGAYVGWVDILYVYLKSSTCNHCPTAAETLGYAGPTTPNAPNATHFWFNRNLSAFSKPKLKRSAATILTGEGGDGREVADGTYSKTNLPPQWRNDFSSPCYRHVGGANYGFVDGHVKWLRPRMISTAPGAAYTFALK